MSTRAAEAARPKEREVLAERNRDRIVGAALDVFAHRGFDGATTAEVARRAGVTQPLVHYHFDTKDELWRAAVSSVLDQLGTYFGGWTNELADLEPVAQLKVLVRRLVYFSAAYPQFGRILSYEGAQGGDRLEWLLEQEAGGQLRFFRDALQRGTEEGWIKQLPIDHVATCLGAAAAYAFIVKDSMQAIYGIDVSDPAVVETHADTVIELFFHGLVPAEAPKVAGKRKRAAPAKAKGAVGA